ncbi:TPA: 4-hydroxyphenylacetate 3-monooxygenase, reductase component [Neisseria gonorrhoeae]|uniref:4-hydroxyphenylacetate 3-monooxygenase, reductase component n=1 Tax=Neisseria gonorrhoeae TaxID=485 RepID=UPI0001AF5C4D|nr:4-hydroxyphenylacetate 3-monooxygenase, reductase component [Neisseria gonorrhoeae]EEZ58508.1 NADH:FMN oxidoreductase [Neisseria gonorrhoeae SK-93-1035]KLT03877.1 MFS transporter [Neisseria gonorrhoeae MU_NG17]MCU4693505.1 4-hydroxyphenylacetate 3-monooxygenase, reductase component [Neisseria gonorrhoeae]ROU28175.1 4-hydroxyphenylacetate 3-monooxygenase, reductase component [Neisseria gonorrhoeae]CFG96913.1 flavoprotein oxidoreductase [Neisseria gonorrhoeae]
MADLQKTFQTSFRDAMASCAAGVHVITTDGAAGRYGITMTAVAPVTDEPPTVMLCINRSARIIPILSENGSLCINMLADEHQDVAEHFAGLTGLSPEERFAYHIWHRGKTGQLEIEGALGHLHGHIVGKHEIGTHFVFYVRLDEIKNCGCKRPALLYFRRQFRPLD